MVWVCLLCLLFVFHLVLFFVSLQLFCLIFTFRSITLVQQLLYSWHSFHCFRHIILFFHYFRLFHCLVASFYTIFISFCCCHIIFSSTNNLNPKITVFFLLLLPKMICHSLSKLSVEVMSVRYRPALVVLLLHTCEGVNSAWTYVLVNGSVVHIKSD